MGLFVVTIVGAILGWLAAIMLGLERRFEVGINVAAGTLGALVVGDLANGASLIDGLTAMALVLAVLGAIACIMIANVVREGVAS